MSIYGHFTQQYYGNKIIFPEKSFLISGISFYTENCSNITYDTELVMKHEPDNKYDPSAISIINNNKIIGYVPNTDTEIKELCKNNIAEPLKIINIKQINGNYGIRVIPKCFYVYDPILENKIFFSDE
jgi:hypothetical protein